MKITPKQFQEIMTDLIVGSLQQEGGFQKGKDTVIPSAMMWGQPGIGKSASVYGLAESIEGRFAELGKPMKVNVVDVRLVLFNPVDLRGIPTTSEDKQFAVWLKPKILDLDTSDDVINLFFMDELSAAPPSVQVCAYQLTHDRKIGEHELPRNTYPICAGNRVTDKSVAFAMSKALANRVAHWEFDEKDIYDGWREWAIDHELDQRVIAFLGFQKSLMNKFDPSNADLAFPTPRSWENVSKVLKIMGNLKKAYPMIGALIGEAPATEFMTYCNVYSKLPQIQDIANGKFTEQFDRADILYAILTGLTINAPKMNDTQLRNTVAYISNMKTEFSVLGGKDLIRNKNVIKRLLTIPEFTVWRNKNKKYLVD